MKRTGGDTEEDLPALKRARTEPEDEHQDLEPTQVVVGMQQQENDGNHDSHPHHHDPLHPSVTPHVFDVGDAEQHESQQHYSQSNHEQHFEPQPPTEQQQQLAEMKPSSDMGGPIPNGLEPGNRDTSTNPQQVHPHSSSPSQAPAMDPPPRFTRRRNAATAKMPAPRVLDPQPHNHAQHNASNASATQQQQQQQPTAPLEEPEEPDQSVEPHKLSTATTENEGATASLLPPSYEMVRTKTPVNPDHFNDFLFALLSYKNDFGNFQVDKDKYPALASWLQLIKREYARFVHHPGVTQVMTMERKKVLESLHVPLTHRGDDHWNRFFTMLETYKERHGHVLVPRLCEVPGLGDWVTDQRRQYKAYKAGKSSQLTKERRDKLQSLGFTWQVRNRPEWEQRFQELLEYKEKHGDCKVPQNLRDNKALGKWVAKQREQYKRKQKGQHSFLSADRQEKLEKVGFAWSVRVPGQALHPALQQLEATTPPHQPHSLSDEAPTDDTTTAANPPLSVVAVPHSAAPRMATTPHESHNATAMKQQQQQQDPLQPLDVHHPHSHIHHPDDEDADHEPIQVNTTTLPTVKDSTSNGGGGEDDNEDPLLVANRAMLV